MRIAIMGAGAMGTTLGAFLSRKALAVDLIDTYQAHVDALNEKGAHITGCVDLTVPVHALTPDQMEGIYDLVFLMVKQTNNEESLGQLLPHLSEESTVCTCRTACRSPPWPRSSVSSAPWAAPAAGALPSWSPAWQS